MVLVGQIIFFIQFTFVNIISEQLVFGENWALLTKMTKHMKHYFFTSGQFDNVVRLNHLYVSCMSKWLIIKRSYRKHIY